MAERSSIGDGAESAQGRAWPVLALLFGATLWGTIWYPLRLLEAGGLHGLWSTLVIYLAALAVTPLLWRHWKMAYLMRRPGHFFGLMLAGGWTNVAFILAVLDGAVLRVLLLFYLSPLWSVLLGHLFLGEPLGRRMLGILGIALGGAAIMLWDPAIGLPWPQERADWLAVSAGFAFSVSNVLVRGMSGVPIGLKNAVTWVGVVLLAVLGLTWQGAGWPATGTGAWLGAAAVGLFFMTLMTYSVQYGVSHMPVQRSAVILLFELVAGALSAWLLAGEGVRPAEWIGGGLIVLAAWLMARRSDSSL